ncbi:hypothetical protein CMI47_20200 [Candidatus Pacearchaeota archaeon]|nr:hypothetical protein [Candidatus Pacearchaeota archaeon]
MSMAMQRAYIERLNYENDSRVKALHEHSWFVTLKEDNHSAWITLNEGLLEGLIDNEYLPADHDGKFRVSVKRIVCEICRGRGEIVNPAIDASGLTAEDFDEDPEFYENYMSGAYDTLCSGCQGLRVQLIPAYPEDLKDEIRAWEDDWSEYEEECRRERIMGC